MIVVVAIVTGFYAWNNSRNDKPQPETTNPSRATESHTTKVPVFENNDEYRSRLTISEWNIIFESTEALRDTEIKYYENKDPEGNESIGFTTSRVEALGGRCSQQPYGNVINLIRSTEKPVTVPHGSLINDSPLSGYYYSYYSGPAGCSSLDENGTFVRSPSETEIKDLANLREFMKTIHPTE